MDSISFNFDYFPFPGDGMSKINPYLLEGLIIRYLNLGEFPPPLLTNFDNLVDHQLGRPIGVDSTGCLV